MKSSKAILGLSVFAVSAAVGAAVLMNNSHESFNLPVRAAEKSFTFDNRAFVVDQFNAEDTSDSMLVAVETNISDEILTEINLTKGVNTELDKSFGTNGHFVENKDTNENTGLKVTIGINNLTGLSITFGFINTDTDWAAYYLHLTNEIEDDEYTLSVSGEYVAIPSNEDMTINWSRTTENPIFGIEFSALALDTFDSIYIKSITLEWEC